MRRLDQLAKFARLVLKRRVALPREVQLEVTNRCNLDCDMCPRLSVLGVPERDMSWETFNIVLDELENPRAITLTGWGEPLMHPRLFDIIDAIHARFPRCDIALTTNGHLLDPERVAALTSRRLARINLSLEELPWEDGGTPAEGARAAGLDPKKGRGNALARDGHPSSERVVAGIRRLVAARPRPGPELRLQVVAMPGGAEVVARLIGFAADEGFDAVNLVRLDPRGRDDLARPSYAEERALIEAARRQARGRGLGFATANDHGLLMRLAAHDDAFCVRLDDYIYVDVDGRVAPCCLLRNAPAGQLGEQSLREVWEGERMRSFYGPRLPADCDGCDAFRHRYAAPPRAAVEV